MIRANKTKRSKYKVQVGWALSFYVDSMQEVNNVINMHGKDKVTFERI